MTPLRNSFPPIARDVSPRKELNVPHHPLPKRRGFTLLELLVVIGSLSVLGGLLVPAFTSPRDAARLAQAANHVRQIVGAMEFVFLDDGEYPLELTDPRLLHYLKGPIAEAILSDSDVFPYYILSIQPGVKDEPKTWSYRVFAGIGINPVKFAGAERGTSRGYAGHLRDGFFEGTFESAIIHRDGAVINRVASPEEDLYWWPFENGTPPPTGTIPANDLQYSVVIGRAAALATPLLESDPNLAKQVRALLLTPEFIALVLQEYNPAWFAPFDDILQLTDAEIEDLSELDLTMLQGDPAFLFSFESLRVLSSLHTSDDEVLLGLLAKLDAAEDAEVRGNAKARAGQLDAFRNQVRAESGKALTSDAARTILAISSTL